MRSHCTCAVSAEPHHHPASLEMNCNIPREACRSVVTRSDHPIMLLTLGVLLGAVISGAQARPGGEFRFRRALPIFRPMPPPPAPPGVDPVCVANAHRGTKGLVTCHAFFSGWTYRLQSDDCAAVEFSGCGTGPNFFDSQEECEALCKQGGDADDGSGGGDVDEDSGDDGDATDVCALPLVRNVPPPPGFVTCQAYFSGWSFDAGALECVAVGVSGCGPPTGNFFNSEAACAEACLTH